MYPNLSDFARKARSGEALTVVFFGGSLTWGANATDPNRTSLRGRLMQFLRKSFPLARWTFVDSAIGGAGSTMAVYRVSRDVLAHAPDLVFMDFSVNDGLSSDADLAAAAYEGILRHILAGAPGCALVPLILPTQDAVLLPDTSSLRRVTLHHALAGHYALPCIDILQGLRDRHRAGTVDLESVWPPELFDTCHPHDAGYAVYAEIVQAALESLLADRPASAAADLPSEWFGPHTYASVLRRRIAEAPCLPSGWRTGFASLRAGTFDFLSSRWMDGLVMAENFHRTGWNERPLTGVFPAPLRIRFRGAVVHLLGESTDLSGKVELHLDGQCLRTVDAGAFGRQFAPSAYLNLPVADGLDPAVDHLLEIRPVSDPATPCELRLESVCVASPGDVAVTFEPSSFFDGADLATGTPGHIETCVSPGPGSIDVKASPDELSAAIQGVLDEAVATGAQTAAQCCVYRDGVCIVDASAGCSGSALFPIFSTEKPLFVTAAHRAVELGLMAYDDPLVRFWPEFAGDGRERITFRHVLGHRTGLPGGPLPGTADADVCDWDFMVRQCAAMKPHLEPGTRSEYLAMTLAWILGEPLRRVFGADSLDDVLREQVLVPAGIADDFFFAADDAACARAVTVQDGVENYGYTRMNRDVYRRACIPSVYALSNAHALARFYTRLCGYDGAAPLIRPETLENALQPNRGSGEPVPDNAALCATWQTVWGLGYGLWGRRGELGRIFGQGGLGGCEGLCDRASRTAIGYTCAISATACGKPYDLRPDLYRLAGIFTRYSSR